MLAVNRAEKLSAGMCVLIKMLAGRHIRLKGVCLTWYDVLANYEHEKNVCYKAIKLHFKIKT